MTRSVAIMSKCPRAKKFMKKIEGGFCCKRHGNTYRNSQKRGARRAIFLTSEAFIARYDELTKLSEQLAATLRISKSLQSKRKKCTKCNGIVAGRTEKQAANFLSVVQNVTMHPTQLASSSQSFWDSKLEANNMKHNTASKYKKSVKEKKKDRTVSDNGKDKTKNLVTKANDQYTHNKGKYSKLTRENTKNKAETENELNTGNVLKKKCSEEIIKNDAKKEKSTRKKFRKIFSNHIPVPKMLNILKKQLFGDTQYVKGNLRINPFAYKYAYLNMNNEERDLLIMGTSNRNRAFEGDLVVACVNPQNLWRTSPDGEVQKTGKIVCILEKIHSRRAVGCIKKQDSLLLFYPRDRRIPLVEILPESVPSLYRDQPELFKDMLFLVNIDLWEQLYAFGRILSVVGKYGEINTELTAVILQNDLDLSPYHESLLEGLPGSDYILTDADMKDREDWRHECIFTIDPVTAVDIDDALSCKILDNGNYEIGVHISDVTHYLIFSSPLDEEVLKRATTIYLPHTTSHMLPEELCKVCSLLPGKDKLAFSVIWEMTPEAEIVKHRFAKTVIRSCCQMSYDSAQAMLDDPEKSWSEDFLDIKGNYTASLLSDIVNKLFKISTHLQNKRFVNGALKLNKPTLQISIDPVLSQQHGIPIPVNYHVYERTDSNSLIEEFMLLANITVAAQLYIAIPETALLRMHKDPSKQCLNSLHDILQKYGIHLNIETAGDLQASISRYEPENNSVTVDSMKYITMVIVNLCSRTMARAEYICASTTSLYNLKHYALNVPLYTHFTSPIRRYSDCIVHRLLSATLENKPLPKKWTVKLCSKIATNCNIKKYNAKLAYEQSTEVFFAYLVGLAGGFKTIATVSCIKGDSIEVILCDTGLKLKVKFQDIENVATTKYSTDHIPTITVNWKEPPIEQIINLFSLVHVQITKISEELRIKATLLPPSQQ